MPTAPHTPRRSLPRRIVWAVVLLVAGAVISVGVAGYGALQISLDDWSTQLLLPPDPPDDRYGQTNAEALALAASHEDARVALIRELCALPDAQWRAGVSGLLSDDGVCVVELNSRAVLSYKSLHIGRTELHQDSYYVEQLSAGWPWRCVHGFQQHILSRTLGYPKAQRGLLRAPGWMAGAHRPGWLLDQVPWLPLWPGLLFNTLFYATILWTFFFGLGFIRRARRRAKGRCVFCGYSLTGLVPGATCPECGAE